MKEERNLREAARRIDREKQTTVKSIIGPPAADDGQPGDMAFDGQFLYFKADDKTWYRSANAWTGV